VMEHPLTGPFGDAHPGMTLQQAVFAGMVDPDDLVIVRQIDDPTPAPGTVDTAVFSGLRTDYDCVEGGVVTSPCPLTSDGGTTQVVHARGSRADGTDTIRNVERLKFGDVVPPPAPTQVTAVAGDASATVSWKRPAGPVTTFEIEVTDLRSGTVTTVSDVSSDGTSRVVTGLSNRTPYTFRVRAINPAGAGEYSASTDPVTPTLFVPPPVQPVLTSRLTHSAVRVGRPVAVTGTVAPFHGVTVTLSRELPDGTVRIVARTRIESAATNGRFRLPVPTATTGLRAYHVTVTGPTIVGTSGPSLVLRVFRVDVTRVSPRGREYVTLQNTGRVATQIGGWRLRNRVGRVLVLPKLTLAAGAKVKVYTGKGHSTRRALFLGRGGEMWFPGHDTVRLYDAQGSPLDKLRY
jgi:fibronectin type III domain protein/lamin tail-like protein